jgi:hypothetical protein
VYVEADAGEVVKWEDYKGDDSGEVHAWKRMESTTHSLSLRLSSVAFTRAHTVRIHKNAFLATVLRKPYSQESKWQRNTHSLVSRLSLHRLSFLFLCPHTVALSLSMYTQSLPPSLSLLIAHSLHSGREREYYGRWQSFVTYRKHPLPLPLSLCANHTQSAFTRAHHTLTHALRKPPFTTFTTTEPMAVSRYDSFSHSQERISSLRKPPLHSQEREEGDGAFHLLPGRKGVEPRPASATKGAPQASKAEPMMVGMSTVDAGMSSTRISPRVAAIV